MNVFTEIPVVKVIGDNLDTLDVNFPLLVDVEELINEKPY